MAQYPFRAQLQSMTFPMLSEFSGRTVITPGIDQTFVPGVSVPGDGQIPLDRAVAQVMYAHNVMPSGGGYQSVAFDIAYEAVAQVSDLFGFDSCDLIRGAKVVGAGLTAVITPANRLTYLAKTGAGARNLFYLDSATKKWLPLVSELDLLESTEITVATVNGVTYIFFSQIGCYVFDWEAKKLVRRTLTGLDETKVLGLLASNGYLITYTQTAIAWSSVVNVEDFTPSEVSGAGGGSVQEAKGFIVTAAVTSLGFILYTRANAVSVIYSGNADFPWNLKAIAASGGVASPKSVAHEQLQGYHQVYTTNGLQQIAPVGAKTIYSQITDFTSGQTFEDFDSATNTLIVQEFQGSLKVGVAVVADRYLIVSYSLPDSAQFTHCIVVDTAQSRMGKLKLEHVLAFELQPLEEAVSEAPRSSMAFLAATGEIKVIDFNLNSAPEDSVVVMGKYQYVRQRMMELHQVEVENVRPGAKFELLAIPSLDGKNLDTPRPGYLLEDDGNLRVYAFDGVVGTNLSLAMKGQFNLTSLLLWFSIHGRP